MGYHSLGDLAMLQIWEDKRRLKKVIIFLVWFAILPFFLRIGMDSFVARRQPVLEIYRDWRWGSNMRQIPSGSTVIFENRRDMNTDEGLFLAQLQRDFRVVQSGSHPIVRVYLEKGTIVVGHIEVLFPGEKVAKNVWVGDTRFPNNGLLFGVWLGLLLTFLGIHPLVGIFVAAGGMLVWSSHWNLLDVPRLCLDFIVSLISELKGRSKLIDWKMSDLGGFTELSALAWVMLSLIGGLIFWRRKLSTQKMYWVIVVLSLCAEPLILMLASKLSQWPATTSWWKIYLGSFASRYMSFGVLFFLLLKPFPWVGASNPIAGRRFLPYMAVLMLPFVFVMCQGWGWLNAVLIEELPGSILRLKVFLVGFILALAIGSRMFSLWLGVLAMTLAIPPSRGHWNAAAAHAFLMEGLFWGWVITPFKALGAWRPIFFEKRSLHVVLIMSWFLGIFLSAVGFPVGICWLVLCLAIWAYRHIAFTQSFDVQNALVEASKNA